MLLNTRLELIGLEESFIIGLAFGHEKIYFHWGTCAITIFKWDQ